MANSYDRGKLCRYIPVNLNFLPEHGFTCKVVQNQHRIESVKGKLEDRFKVAVSRRRKEKVRTRETRLRL